MKRRSANAILIGFAAIGGGVAAAGMPVALLERAVAASGLAAMVPAAAPPLGETARAVLVALAGLGAAIVVALALALPWGPRRGDEDEVERLEDLSEAGSAARAEDAGRMGLDDMTGAEAVATTPDEGEAGDISVGDAPDEGTADGDAGEMGKTMGFALSKFSLFRRGAEPMDAPEVDAADRTVHAFVAQDEVPVLRRFDAHPDAPARQPLVASRDLGAEALPPVDRTSEPEPVEPMPMVRDVTGLSMPHAPEPLPWETIQQEMERLLKTAHPSDTDMGDVMPQERAERQPTIAELADRLERGLERRRAAARGEDAAPAFARPQVAPLPGGQGAMPTPAMRAPRSVAPVRGFEQSASGAQPSALNDALAALRTVPPKVG